MRKTPNITKQPPFLRRGINTDNDQPPTVSRPLGWFTRNANRAFKLIKWLATGQFRRVLEAFLHNLPLVIRRNLLPLKSSSLHRLGYRDQLIMSLFRPEIEAPYREQEAYFITFMESYRSYFRGLYRGRPQLRLISIIMPTYNRANCISDAINSVLNQQYENWELIIVDDGGDDSTPEILAAFNEPRIQYYRLETNQGASAARNLALSKATGEFITYLDADNTIETDFLLILANQLIDNEDYDIAYCAQRGYFCNNKVSDTFMRFSPFNRASLENKNYLDLGVVMHKIDLVEKFGFFNTKMRRLGDWEFILRYTGGKAPKAIPAILSNYYSAKANNRITDVYSSQDGFAYVNAYLQQKPISETLPDILLPGIEDMYSLPYSPPHPKENRPVSIVIPSYESEDYLKACVRSIEAFTRLQPYELIIVDNASSLGVTTWLKQLSGEGRAKVIFNDVNYGFTYAVNQGIGASISNSDIVIMNNDAVVTEGWLGALQVVVEDCPDAGLVVPRQMALPGEKTLKTHQPWLNPERECDINISIHHSNVIDAQFGGSSGYINLAFAPFFCVYVPRETLDTIGLLDVENGPHYRSDRLFCDLLSEMTEKKIIYTPHSKVYHYIQRSTNFLRGKDADRFKKMFVENDWKAISDIRSMPNRNSI